MYQIDQQERKIIRELIRNPRISDNQIGKNTKVPIRTVSRKRNKLEKIGLLNYLTFFNNSKTGTSSFGSRHLYVVKFRLGITREQIIKEIKEEKMVKMSYGRYIYESHLAEVEGHVALVLILEGKTDDDIVESFNKEVITSLLRNHGQDSIKEVSTIRLSDPIRMFHNYITLLNIENGRIKKEWPDELIFFD